MPTWDEATKTVTQRIGRSDTSPNIEPYYYVDDFFACGTPFPDARRIVITSDQPLRFGMSTKTLRRLLRDGSDEVKIELEYTDHTHEPSIGLSLSEWPTTKETAPQVRITSDGIDLNNDGDTDLTIKNIPAIKRFGMTPAKNADPIILDATKSAVPYREISTTANLQLAPIGRKYTITNPGGHAQIWTTNGHDTITVTARTTDISTRSGNDLINARRVTHGGTYTGGNGNDRLLLGPGPDIISARRGSDGNDRYDTGAGDDRIFNTGGSDTIITGAGNDQVTTIAATGETMKVNTGPGNDTFADFSSAKPGKTTVNLGTGNDRALIFGKPSLHWLATTINCGPGQDHVFALGTNPRNRGCEHTTR